MTTRELRVLPDSKQLTAAVVTALLRAVETRLASHPRADIVLTGGVIGTEVACGLAAAMPAVPLPWPRVHLWWGDERYVGLDADDRNDLAVVSALTPLGSNAPITHRVEGAAAVSSVQHAADAYGAQIDAARFMDRGMDRDAPFFTVVLLGLGPDGHVASLFPGTPGLTADSTCIAVTDSPKPPPMRVSMTLGTINDAEQVWILASGAAKHQALDALVGADIDASDLPARGAHGASSTIIWADTPAMRGSAH